MKWHVLLLIAFLFSAHRVTADEVHEEEETEQIPDLVTILTEEEEQQFAEVRSRSKQAGYQTEVSQLMKIIVNNLYRKKKVFLRELISNAFDALEKARFLRFKDKEIFSQDHDLSIHIKVDPVHQKLEITDTGIGMTREELSINLGTIAKSGTSDFIKKIGSEGSSTAELSQQIGQFGVGFYSAFLVSDRVVVVSRSANDSTQNVFEADTSGYSVYEDPRGVTMARGTSVILSLNPDSHEFAKEDRIESLIRKYSDFLKYPIYLYTNKDADGKEVPRYWKHVNDVEALWMRPPSNITDEEYESFFNLVTYERKHEKYAKPTAKIHFSAEGSTNFVALLFIPDKLDPGYFNSPGKLKNLIRLYVRRVFISDDMHSILPFYLVFMSGVIDSDDFQLNVGRDMPQHSELIKVIRKKLTRKILDHIKKMSEGDQVEYKRFYDEFGNALKFGVMEDDGNSNRLARLLRFYSSTSEDKYTTLDDYVSRMKPGQPGIFFLTASSIEDAQKSPYLERFKFKNYEILYLLSNIDEAVMQNLRVFDNKAIHNVAKEVSDIPETESDEKMLKEKEEEMKPLLKWLKKSYLKGRVASVRASGRLLKSSCILIAPEQGYSGSMDRMIRSQSHVHGKGSGYDQVLDQPKNLELNPYHPLVKDMLRLAIDEPDSQDLKENAEICLSIATLSGGYSVNDGVQLAGIVERLYLKHQALSPEEVSRQIYEELGLDEEEVEEKVQQEEELSPDSSQQEEDSESVANFS